MLHNIKTNNKDIIKVYRVDTSCSMRFMMFRAAAFDDAGGLVCLAVVVSLRSNHAMNGVNQSCDVSASMHDRHTLHSSVLCCHAVSVIIRSPTPLRGRKKKLGKAYKKCTLCVCVCVCVSM